MQYTGYNLLFQSDIPLPELLSHESDKNALPDVTIRFATIGSDGLPDGKQLGPFLWVSAKELWLQIPKVARFLVQGGNTILIDPEPGIDEDSLRVFLLGSALGALLFQRGYLVIHGNAIQIGDQCMVCVGQSGAGKSTLAAGFMKRGYPILADDVVPVDKACNALPGFPRIKIWQDVADHLKIDTSGLRRIRPNIEKFNYPLQQQFAAEPLPIRWIYILGSENIDNIRFEPIQGMQRFPLLYNNTYRARYLEGMEIKPLHLQLCGKLASKIRLAKVTRSQSGFALDQLIDHLLADMASNP